MKIYVTDTHIKRGKRKNPTLCPISLALAEHTGFFWITKGCSTSCAKIYRLTLPQTAIDFMDKYDRKEKVEPFSFELPIEMCDEVAELI